jgi:hypothetical protein
MVPVIDATIDHNCAYSLVGQGAGGGGPLPPVPVISIVGDDIPASLGPAGFRPSLRKLFRRADAAVIVSCAPEQRFYATAASVAVLERRNAIIVECRPETELEWLAFAKKHLRTGRIMLCTPKPEGRPQ